GGFVVLDVDPVIRHPVAGEELAQPPRVGREARPDHPRSGAGADQDLAPRHERAQDEGAERLVLVDDRAELLEGDLDHLPRGAHHAGKVKALPEDESELAEEAAALMERDEPVPATVVLDDRHRARLDHEEALALLPRREEHLARLDLPDLAPATEPLHLVVVK